MQEEINNKSELFQDCNTLLLQQLETKTLINHKFNNIPIITSDSKRVQIN